jgi:hypothetical protein
MSDTDPQSSAATDTPKTDWLDIVTPQPTAEKIRPTKSAVTLKIRLKKPALPTLPKFKLPFKDQLLSRYPFLGGLRARLTMGSLAAIIVLAEIISIVQPYLVQRVYALGAADGLLSPINQVMANDLTFKAAQQEFDFKYQNTASGLGTYSSESNGVSATAYPDASKGITVTDSVHNISFTMTPKFGLWTGKQDGNRIVYPLTNASGWAVYTMHSIGVKEDIVLTSSRSDAMSFDYNLGLGNNLSARIQKDGSVGIYGNTLLSGNVSTGDAKDAALLQKARAHATKDTMLFNIPAPVIMGLGNKLSSAKARYTVKGNDLKVTVTGLAHAAYPLTIDPSIFVSTAQQFMQGNNETNIDFDVADKLIEKGKTSGARFNSWSSTTAENTATWRQGVAVAGGYIYMVGGVTSSGSDAATVSWAAFNTTTGAITSANPGNGNCSNWCTNSVYNLPASRGNLSLVAYNGFLFAIGGEDSNCISTNGNGDGGVCSTVYEAKLGANGEPQLWSPTSTVQSTWTYWYKDSNLTSPRSMMTVTAYENYIYLIGGKTSSGGTASLATTAQVASITAPGTLSSWTTTTMPSAYSSTGVYGYGSQIYNGYIYVIGGATALSPTSASSSVYYSKINSDGTLNTWVQTTSLVGGRFDDGGSFTSSWGGYIYLSGGCSAFTSGYCSTVDNDTQLASINSDGSLDSWNDISGVTDSRVGQNFVVWRYNLYNIGGCSAVSTSTGACTTYLSSINEGTINSMGDISTVTTSVASGTAPCSGTTPYNCNLPSTGNGIGGMLNATAIINGFIYITGGCLSTGCGSPMAQDTAYAAISNSGELTKPANCATDGNTLFGAWCVDSTHTLNPGNNGNGHIGVAGAGTAVFNDTIYYVGGFSGGGLTGEIYSETMNTDGSLTANWTFTTMSTIGATGVAYDYAFARSNPSSAGTAPGNLYIVGGCSAVSGTSCTTYTGAVYKCNITTSNVPASCSTTNQLQFGTASGASGAGIAGMGGTVYANYVYLIGGSAPGVTALNTVYYATINNSNNVVAVSGSAWSLETNTMNTARSFASGYGYNGFLYVLGGYNSTNGVLGSVEFAEIDVSNGSIGTFTTSSVTFTGSWGTAVPVANSYAYVVAGCGAGAAPSSCSSLLTSVRSFQIYNNDSGAPVSYAASSNTYSTASNRIGASTTIMNGYIYVAGGCTSTTDCTTATSDVSYAALDANGNVGAWSSATNVLPAATAWGKLENAGGSLYYIGGQNGGGTAQTAVYYATPSSGNITSAWGTATDGLPAARTQFGAAMWNNRLYVLGGYDGTSRQATVYVSPQQSSGGNITSAWSTSSTSFNVARSGLTVVAYANNIYVIGGFDGTNYLSDSQFAQISTSNGSVGSWTYSTSLPNGISQADGFAANGYIYLIGGRSAATTCSNATLVAPISANTTIASGNNPTGLGQWFQTSQNLTGTNSVRYGSAVAYGSGKAYVLGGGCGSTLTYATTQTQQTSLLSQPQVAQYSIEIDTNTDVFPSYWLMNGLDNSIGAEWQLKYESMTNTTTACTSPAMTNWGQITNYGNVTLGTTGTYTPLNGSGVNTNCARFYDFNVTVDSSQAFGYPDDVTRGPTITNLTLEFTADPSKRLMHGRTFTGGLQQPDDTPKYSH